MTALAKTPGCGFSDAALRLAFLKWQCRVRQLAMRDGAGRPDDAVMPEVLLPGAPEPFGRIITLMSKSPAHSVTAEMRHMYLRTNDPAERRAQALRFLSATYFQNAAEFSDILTATFAPGSPGAAEIRRAGTATLIFDAFAQRFDLVCRVWKLTPRNPLHRATMAHNSLFNPALAPLSVVLGFEPDWSRSNADPGLS